MKVYLASSWRNARQPAVLAALRKAGHKVYDFRKPSPVHDGFSWRSIDPQWEYWTPTEYRDALKHHVAEVGFSLDMEALRECDVCVLLMPCGRSAHLELGWAAGAGKLTYALIEEQCEPELMYSMLDRICLSIDELIGTLAIVGPSIPRSE
jgi:nucleoside 2-deoxyribosyltransferase